MNKIFCAVSIVTLLLVASCFKPAPTVGTPLNNYFVGTGVFSFAGVTDSATTCVYDTSNHGLTGSNNSSSNYSNYTSLRIGFLNTLTSGTYTVIPGTTTPTGTQVNIEVATGIGGSAGSTFYATGAGGNQTVSVNVANGKVTMTGTNINIISPATTFAAADTTVLSLNLIAAQ